MNNKLGVDTWMMDGGELGEAIENRHAVMSQVTSKHDKVSRNVFGGRRRLVDGTRQPEHIRIRIPASDGLMAVEMHAPAIRLEVEVNISDLRSRPHPRPDHSGFLQQFDLRDVRSTVDRLRHNGDNELLFARGLRRREGQVSRRFIGTTRGKSRFLANNRIGRKQHRHAGSRRDVGDFDLRVRQLRFPGIV
ncbi:MAG: hypothetical protein ACREIA_17000 [Opitutaceae bacterium]